MEDLGVVLPFVAIALAFWLLVVRPASRRSKQVRALQDALAVGDRIMLTSGIYGELVDLSEERARVEIAPDVVIEVARGAVGAVERADVAVGEDAGDE